MATLRLAKLPDRVPVKITISISPNLNQCLVDYAAVYRETYGVEEPVVELVPLMLEAFLAADRGFLKARPLMGRKQVRD